MLLRGELHGSLRKLRGHPMLMQDRYSSLQKRGMIEPRTRINRRKTKRVYYQSGDRADLARQGQDELDALKKRR